jgi:hypothetical protein
VSEIVPAPLEIAVAPVEEQSVNIESETVGSALEFLM